MAISMAHLARLLVLATGSRHLPFGIKPETADNLLECFFDPGRAKRANHSIDGGGDRFRAH